MSCITCDAHILITWNCFVDIHSFDANICILHAINCFITSQRVQCGL